MSSASRGGGSGRRPEAGDHDEDLRGVQLRHVGGAQEFTRHRIHRRRVSIEGLSDHVNDIWVSIAVRVRRLVPVSADTQLRADDHVVILAKPELTQPLGVLLEARNAESFLRRSRQVSWAGSTPTFRCAVCEPGGLVEREVAAVFGGGVRAIHTGRESPGITTVFCNTKGAMGI